MRKRGRTEVEAGEDGGYSRSSRFHDKTYIAYYIGLSPFFLFIQINHLTKSHGLAL